MKKLFLLLSVIFTVNYSFAQIINCAPNYSLTSTPPISPQGTYISGTTVTFCYSVTNYIENEIDWLCGIEPVFGPGWDLTTLTPISFPAPCSMQTPQGNWAWYTADTAVHPPWPGTIYAIYGPGFYYDQVGGTFSIPPQIVPNGIPGDNFGDGPCNQPTYVRTFCFSIQAKSCGTVPDGTDLTVTIHIYGDYEAGSWTLDGCRDSIVFPATIFSPNPLTVPTVITTDVTCYGDSTGTAYVAATAGFPPYQYLWNTGQTTQSITGLTAGIYSVHVTDSAGCFKNVYMLVQEPPEILANATVIPIGCDTSGTGSIITNTSGGTPPYNYLWSNTSTTANILNLSAGSYILTITDSVGCIMTNTYVILQAIPVNFTSSSTSATCGSANGTATITVTSGTPPFSYSWTPPVSTGPTATGLTAGTYYITVTDSNGCLKIDSVVVNTTSTVTVSVFVAPVSCDPGTGGTATANPIGTPPYTYQWSPSGGNGQTATNLPPGTYTVLVTDSNLCTATDTAVIVPVIPISFTTTTINAQCNNSNSGSASITTTTGGTAPYNYAWSNGSTNSSITGVAPGTYTFVITDVNSCTATGTVTIGQNPVVNVTVNADTTVCSGQPVILNANGSGGTPLFNYSWSNGVNSQSQQVNPTTTTTYNVVITDVTGCTAMASVIVTVVSYPVISLTNDATICSGSSIALNASGGNSYSWTPSSGLNNSTIPDPLASPSVTTNYIVTVSNGNCSSVDSVLITVVPSPVAAFTADTSQGIIPLTVNFTNNSTGGVSYSWNFGDGSTSTSSDPTHVFTVAGTYTVTLIVTGSNGCTDTLTFKIIAENFSSLDFPNIFTPNTDGDNDVFHLIEYGLLSVNVEIYNRWGLKVFSWNKLNGEWNGRTSNGDEAPDGTYFLIINATGADGKDYKKNGTLTLVRKQ